MEKYSFHLLLDDLLLVTPLLIKALKGRNVHSILIIYLIPDKNNGQKVCFKGNLKRLVTMIET
jgi:hypothetical protein